MISKNKSKDYFKLFVKREGKVVWGRNYSNLWLLILVLTLTFGAISFSNASLNYLSFKMNDPFINWVDIQNDYGEGDINGLLSGLSDSANMERFHFVDHQVDYSNHYMFYGKDNHLKYLACRFFNSFKDNPLISAILDGQNVVGGASCSVQELNDETIGMIITEDAIKKLGYEEFPAFLNLSRFCKGAEQYGFELDNNFGKLPIPVIAVVKRLPMNMDIISTKFFYEQQRNDMTYPFNLNHIEYASSLHYFIPESLEENDFKLFLKNATADSCEISTAYLPFNKTFKKGHYVSVNSYSQAMSPEHVKTVDSLVNEKYGSEDIHRLYNYLFSKYELPMGAYVSVQFSDLDEIREFESFLKNEYMVRIEMSQINAKENFNAVSVMANILSWAIIAFSIICIILFVVNLFQSYFQKVKRNMGTFKAFGISNSSLISIYVLIMIVTIILAILISLAFIYSIQNLLPLFNIMKDSTFNYLELWSMKTIYSILIIVLCSVSTVYFVMNNLLKATPGDLIYDRK